MIASGPLTDSLIHHRLSKGGLILLIVTVSSVSDYINKNIFLELLSIINSKLDDLVDLLRIISVHMNDRSLDCFCHICAIETTPSFSRGCSKANLVIGHNMDDAIDVIMVKI